MRIFNCLSVAAALTAAHVPGAGAEELRTHRVMLGGNAHYAPFDTIRVCGTHEKGLEALEQVMLAITPRRYHLVFEPGSGASDDETIVFFGDIQTEAQRQAARESCGDAFERILPQLEDIFDRENRLPEQLLATLAPGFNCARGTRFDGSKLSSIVAISQGPDPVRCATGMIFQVFLDLPDVTSEEVIAESEIFRLMLEEAERDRPNQ